MIIRSATEGSLTDVVLFLNQRGYTVEKTTKDGTIYTITARSSTNKKIENLQINPVNNIISLSKEKKEFKAKKTPKEPL